MRAAQFYILTALSLVALCLAILITAMRESADTAQTTLLKQQETLLQGKNAQQSYLNLARELAPHTATDPAIAELFKKYRITVADKSATTTNDN